MARLGREDGVDRKPARQVYPIKNLLPLRGPGDPTEYDCVVAHAGLSSGSAEEAFSSSAVRTWVQKFHRTKYVPEKVLALMGLEDVET